MDPCGEIADVVVDSVKRRVTHLVVQPHREHDQSRLIAIDAVVSIADLVTQLPAPRVSR